MATAYAIPKFHFVVEFGGSEFNCTEVSGLGFETEIIEYRGGADKKFHKTKQAGLRKYGNITGKRGTFEDTSKEFYDQWAKTVYYQEKGDQYRGDLTIKLLDEAGSPVVTWQATNTFISKLTSTDLKADANEVAIETVEWVIEELIIQ